MGTFLLGILVVVNVVLLVLLAAVFRRTSGSSQTAEITDLAQQTAMLHESLSQKFNDATLGALQAGGHIERGVVELLAKRFMQQRRLLGKVCYFSGLRRARRPAKKGRQQYQKYNVDHEKYADQ